MMQRYHIMRSYNVVVKIIFIISLSVVPLYNAFLIRNRALSLAKDLNSSAKKSEYNDTTTTIAVKGSVGSTTVITTPPTVTSSNVSQSSGLTTMNEKDDDDDGIDLSSLVGDLDAFKKEVLEAMDDSGMAEDFSKLILTGIILASLIGDGDFTFNIPLDKNFLEDLDDTTTITTPLPLSKYTTSSEYATTNHHPLHSSDPKSNNKSNSSILQKQRLRQLMAKINQPDILKHIVFGNSQHQQKQIKEVVHRLLNDSTRGL